MRTEFSLECSAGFAGEDPRFLSPDAKPQYAPHRAFKPLHIRLDLKVDVKKKHAEGTCTTDIELFENVHAIEFNAAGMKVESVELNGKKTKYEHADEKITIPLPSKTEKKKHVVRIHYSVSNPTLGIFFTRPTKDHPTKPYQAWTHSEAQEARYWYPCQDQPESKCSIEQHITVEDPFMVVSNGVLVGKKAISGKKWTTYSWKMDSPNATYLNAFMVGEFGVVKDKWKHVSVEYYAEKGREAEAQRSFANTPKMLDFFSKFTQYDYPHKKYAQIMVTDFIYGGMEHTTCTTQTDRALQDEVANREYWYFPELLASHELAHQWFGDLLTCNDWMHGWLNESFATYMETLWMEHEHGEDAFAYEQYVNYQIYLDEDKNRYRRPIVSNIYTQPTEMFDRHLYEKGSLVLNMIRNILGKKEFQKAIAHYVNTHAHTAVQTEDLIESIREATGKNLTQLFDQWVYAAGYPELKVSTHYDPRTKKANVRVIQTTKIDDKSLFQFPVTIAITLPNNKIEEHRVDITKREHRFSFPVRGEPHSIVFDPENVIIKAIQQSKPRKYWVYQLTNDPRMVQRILAVQEIGKNPSPDEWKTLEHALVKDPFWGVRGQTALTLGSIRHPEAEKILHRAYHTETNPRVTRAIIGAIGNFSTESTRKILHLAMQRKDSYIIPSEAYKSLGRQKNTNDLTTLKKGVTIPSWIDIIGVGAITGIASQQTTAAMHALIAYTDPKYNYSIRTAAVNALAEIGIDREKVVPALLNTLKDPYYNLQLAAIAALGKLGDERALSALEKFKTGAIDGRVKRAALESIRLINGGVDLPLFVEEKVTKKQ